MEYYVMPQVDKSASTYSPPVQYVPALPARPELNKYGVSSDILTSCDWSAVIHRPAEDSEPEDLPSTVDMDAIKEPATPLPPMTPAPPPVSEEDSDSEEETSNSDSDSSSDTNTESQGSGSGSGSSDSSDESSGKKNSSNSSPTPSPQTTFSIRETNFEQGGLKLKISATKPKMAVKVRSCSSSSDPYDSSSSEEDVRSSAAAAGRRREGGRSRVTKEAAVGALRRKPAWRRQTLRARGRLMGRQQASRRSPRTLLKPKEGCDESSSTSSSSSSSEEEEDAEEEDAEAEEGDEMAQLATQLGSSEHSIPISEHLQVINEEDLAAILPDVGGGSLDGFEAGATSTTTGGGPSGSSSGGGPSTSQQPAPTADSLSSSSSDAELLPGEVVSEAISRIQVEPETCAGQQQRAPPSPRPSTHHTHQHHVGRCYSSNLLEDFVEKTEMLSRGGEPPGAGTANSSELGRKKRGRPPKSARQQQQQAPAAADLESYPCQSNVSPDSGIQSVAGSPAPHQSSPVSSPPPPHLRRRPPPPPLAINDAITKMQSKQGELKLENGGKRGPGRPKGRKNRGRSAGGAKKEVVKKKSPAMVLPPAAAELKVPPYIAGSVQATQIPSLPGTSKRGRGRPRKEGGPPPLLAPPPPPAPNSRSASCPRLLRIKQHKHRRRRRLRLDPTLAAEVDHLAQELQRVVIGSAGVGHRPLEGGIPPVFRVKRVVKKRKEKEERRKEKEDKEERRKEKEDKEETGGGGKEVAGGSPPRAASPLSSAPATPAPATAKRRLKKSAAVELPKNREKLEANNEQRLPLKKRHYHMSSATSTNQTSVDSTDKSDSSVDSTQSKPAVRSPAPVSDKSTEKHHHHSGKHHVTGKGGPAQAVSSGKTVSEKGMSQAGVAPQAAAPNGKVASAPSTTTSKSHHTSVKTEVKKTEAKDEGESRLTRSSDQHETVIVTPKKRHCLEADKKTPTIRHALKEEPSLAGKRTPRPKDQSPSTKRTVIARTVGKVDEAKPSSPVTSPAPKRSQRIMESQAAQEAQKKSAAATKTEEPDEKKENKKPEGKVGTIKPEETPIEKGHPPAAVATRSSSKAAVAALVPSTPVEATPAEEKHKKATGENKAKSEKRVEDSKPRSEIREESKSKLEKRPEESKVKSEKTHEENKVEKKIEEQGKKRSERRTEEVRSRPEKNVEGSKVKTEKKEEGRKRSERKAVEIRRKNEKKPPPGVFEPSEKVGGPEALEKIIGATEASAKCVEEVISKIKERLRPFQELENVCVESEPIKVRRANEEEEAMAKKRKLICDVRVHVTKLTPADFILQNVIAPTTGTPSPNKVKVKRKRKPINRTGFPVIRKKKKKVVDPILLSEPKIASDLPEREVAPVVPPSLSQGLLNQDPPVVEVEKAAEASFVSPPILEDQTKLSIITTTTVEHATPALSPIAKVEEVVHVKDELSSMTSEPQQQTSATDEIDLKEEVKSAEPCPPAEEKEMVPESETVDKQTEEETAGESSVRPPSKRIMELRSARAVASDRRKRKSVAEEGDGDLTDSSMNGTESRLSIAKRLRRIRDELEDSDVDSMKLRRKHPQKSKKKYLPAGLFSDYFKEEEGRKQLTSNELAKLRNTYVRSEHPFGLMPPPAYCARWVRQRRRHFQLPHDLWWLHVHNKLPGREAVPSWNYKKIRTNVYFDVKPTLSYEAQACNCEPSSGCDEECINRMVLAECSPQLCPCRESCTNQRIQKHDWAPGIAKFMTKDKGWGVKTKYSIKKDDFILEYVGEVVSEKEFKIRMATRYQNDTHHYCLNLDSGLVIDGHRMGGDGRFVNHSCEPNCEIQKWCVNGLFRMALFALRDIESNEELTYDYNFSLFNPSEGQPCKCGSSKCRGVIGGKWQRLVMSGPGAGAVVTTTGGAAGAGGQAGAGVGVGGAPEGEVRPPGRPRKNNSGDTSNNNGRRKATLVTHTVNKNAQARDSKNGGSSKDGSTSWNGNSNSSSALATVAARLNNLTPVRPLTHQQKMFVLANRCFLVRSLETVRKCRERLKQVMRGGGGGGGGSVAAPPTQHAFITQMTALSVARSVRTRRLAQAQGDEELTKTAKLACILRELYKGVLSVKDERGELLSTPFMSLPSKKKCPEYYARISGPVDLTMVGANITSGVYRSVELFDADMTAVFKNAVRWHGRTSELGIAATRLRRAYSLAKVEAVPALEEALGAPPPAQFLPPKQDPGGEEEDVIRCLCGLYRDEGLMIQCERCLVWQHAWCVARGAEPSSDEVPYLCERCSPREVDLEVPVQPGGPPPSPGQQNYITLLRGDIQLRQGDTVYVLRDIVNEESTTIPKEKHTYSTIKDWKYSDCDIFRIERLWKDDDGKRFAFGHHYLRPHETFHEPTRRFFENEVMRVPLYEVVPVELIMGHCTVLDLNTFCKGRPIGSSPEHTYICEYRVDKYARMFAKIPKPKSSSVCTKSYAFEMYDVRLKPQRTYAPHGITDAVNANRGRGEKNGGTANQQNTTNGNQKQQTTNASQKQQSSNVNQKQQRQSQNNKQSKQLSQEIEVEQVSPEETMAINRERKKSRLNGYLLKLLSKLPSKQPLDLSFLLEPGRRQRKKPLLLSS